MIQFECECGRVIKTGDENAGRKAKCPECGDVVQIPKPKGASRSGKSTTASSSQQVKSGKPTSRKARKPQPQDDEFDDDEAEAADYADDDDDELPPARSRKKAGSKRRGDDDDDEKPSKKKKKGSKAESKSSNTALIVGCVVGGLSFVVVGIVVAFVMTAPGGKSDGAKTTRVAANALPELEQFAMETGELSCLAPKGWDAKSGGGSGGVPVFASFEKGKIKIQFRSSPSGTAIGAIAQAGNQNPADLPDDLKPVSTAHDYQKKKFEAEVSGYKETGEAKIFKCKGFGGEGKMSPFTADDGTFGQSYGYRGTYLGNNRQWNVVCKCRAADWKTYQPLFLKIMESAAGN